MSEKPAEQNPTEATPEAKKQTSKEDEGILAAAAKAIGSAAGTVVSLTAKVTSKAAAPATARKPKNHGRIPKSNKSRLPRKAKKLLAKKNAAKAV
jgi:hypothetical protein